MESSLTAGQGKEGRGGWGSGGWEGALETRTQEIMTRLKISE